MTDHDQLFKHLLQTFFTEFLAAFVPELRRDLDPASVQFLDKELIRARGGRRRTRLVDLVVRVRFQDQEGFVLVHLEHQARRSADIGYRLFLYAAWLMDRYGLPVYPLLVASYDQPRNAEPDRFVMAVRGLRVVDFRYRVVQLNRMDWRRYARLNNPAAAALLAKMKIRPADRVKVKVQILRLLATLRLQPEKMDLVAGFMETYLALTAREELAFERELDKIDDREQKASVMELMTSWERKGRAQGQLDLVKLQLKRRFGALKPATIERLSALGGASLAELAEALLDFKSLADLHTWLNRRLRVKEKAES